MILSHTFYPPGWNFPSDTHTQSSQAHTQAPTHKEATLEINIFWHCDINCRRSISVCLSFRVWDGSFTLIVTDVILISTETLLLGNKSRTVYMLLLHLTPESTRGALVTRIPFSFKKSLINSEYHQWAKFSWSTGPAGRNNSKMSKGMNNVDSLLIVEPHVAFTPSGFLDRWMTPGKVETYRRLLLSFISHLINQSVIIEVVEKVKTLSGSSLCEDVMLSCVCALDWCDH